MSIPLYASPTKSESFLDFVLEGHESFDPYEALYIHVPFCKQRCSYCSFYTQAIYPNDAVIEDFVEELIVSIRRLGKAGILSHIKTIYFGGGTPSFLGSRYLTSLLYSLSVSMPFDRVEEVSLECNPESMSLALVKDLWALGVNRLSFGVQSFQDKQLALLGRSHSSDEARRALYWAFERFSNVSLDLMAGLPHQSLEDFACDIATALSFPLTHISLYPLSLDEGTRLRASYDAGLYPAQDEDLQVDMLNYAHNHLQAQGFEHYEISNFALPKLRSQHNSAYWKGVSYLGLGPGAISMRQNRSIRDRFNYQGITEDRLHAKQRLIEDAFLSLRLKEGLSFTKLDKLGAQGDARFSGELERIVEDLRGLEFLLRDESVGAYVPTQKGWLQANYMFAAFLGLEDFL